MPPSAGRSTGPSHNLPKPRLLVAISAVHELVFQVKQEADGGFVAEALGESLFTGTDTCAQLHANVREAVIAFYFDRPAPTSISLQRAQPRG